MYDQRCRHHSGMTLYVNYQKRDRSLQTSFVLLNQHLNQSRGASPPLIVQHDSTKNASKDMTIRLCNVRSEEWLSTVIPVTRNKLIPEVSTAASMPPTVTYMPVLNPVYYCASCSPERPEVQCQDQKKYWKAYLLISILGTTIIVKIYAYPIF